MVATANDRTQELILFEGMLVKPWALGPTHQQVLVEEQGARRNRFVHHIGRPPRSPVFHVQHDCCPEEIAPVPIDSFQCYCFCHSLFAIQTVVGTALFPQLVNSRVSRGLGESRHASRFANRKGRNFP